MRFSDLLRFHRCRLDISQSAVASLWQMPVRTYQSWELGNNAPNQITQKVAVALLESLRTDFMPRKVKSDRPSDREGFRGVKKEDIYRPTLPKSVASLLNPK